MRPIEINKNGVVFRAHGSVRTGSESLAIIDYLDESERERRSGVTADNGWIIRIQNEGSKAVLTATHGTIDIEFCVEFVVHGDTVTLTIPHKRIRESGACRLKNIRPLPGFIAGYEGDGSTLVLPCNTGALCKSRNKSPAEYRMNVFFPYPPVCNMAFFGIDWGNGNAMAAIIESGQFDSFLLVRTCWGTDQQYSVDAAFAIRDYDDDLPIREDIVIRYHPLEGKEAHYAGMARYYRQYHLTCRRIPTLKEKCKDNPTLTYASQAISLRCRMAVKQTPTPVLEQTPETQPPMKVFTTFEDIRILVEECAKQEVGPVEFCLVGWNYGGHDGAFPQRFPVEPALGGERKLRKLIERSHELGYPMSLHDNYFNAYSLANNFHENLINRNHDGTKTLGGKHSGGQSYQICAKCVYENYAVKSIPEVAALGIKGSYYSDVLSLSQLTKCYHPEHPMSRRENAYWWKKLMGLKQEQFGSSYSEGAREWAIPELDRAYSVSDTPESQMPYIDEDIPLFQIVYHGILIYNSFRSAINTFPGDLIYLLNIAYGSLPLIYYHQIFNPEWTATDGWDKDLTFGDVDKLKADVAGIKQITDDVVRLAPIRTEWMEDFVRHSPTLTETVYSNGASVFVNYGNVPAKLSGGEIVPARNFVLVTSKAL